MKQELVISLFLSLALAACGGPAGFFERTATKNNPVGSWDTTSSLNSSLTCDQGSIIRETGTTTTITWTYANAPNPLSPLQVGLRTEPVSSTQGTMNQTGPLTATYTAPATLPFNLAASLTARATDLGVASASCIVHIPEDGAIGIVDDGYTRGLVGKVYPIAVNSPSIPTDLDGRAPVQTIVIGNLNLPDRAFSLGFPDVPGLIEWFAIAFQGRIIIPSTGTYYFQMGSDDGSNLYIDGYDAAHKVINNDGVHAWVVQTGSVNLSAGIHTIRVDWFQGPRYFLGVQLFWRTNTGAPWVLVPWNSYLRPT